MTPSIVNQIVEQEFRSLFHDRIRALCKKITIAREVVVIPQMQAQPCATHGPEAGMYAINRNRIAPDVGIVMNHKAPRVVEVFGNAAPVIERVVDEIEQRLVKLREVGDLRGPVIHFGIDVDRVLAIPRWFELLVPNALKIRRHRTGPAAGDQQIPAELKVQSLEGGIGRSLLYTLQAFVRGDIRRSGAELEFYTAKEPLVVGYVRGAELGVRLRAGGQILFCRDFQILLLKIRRCGENHRRGVRILQFDGGSFGAHVPAVMNDLKHTTKLHTDFALELLPLSISDRLAFDCNSVGLVETRDAIFSRVSVAANEMRPGLSHVTRITIS